MSSIIGSDVATAGSAQGSGLTREQVKNLTLASLGSLLEFYEFMVFGFLTAVIARQFFPPSMPDPVKTFQAFAIFTLGFLLRPLSGAVLGHLGDRLGRKKLFLFTVFAMAVPTILIGLLPTYAQIGVAAPVILLVLRMAQGIAIAGEFAGAAVFVSEHVPGDRVGHALGWMMGGSYLGFFAGAAMAALLSNTLDPAALDTWGWRVAFIVGGIFGLVAVYLRRALDETPLFREIMLRKGASKAFPLRDVLRDYVKPTLFVTGCGAYLGIMVLIVYFYMPTFLQVQYGFERTTVFNANAAALLMLAVMCPVWGWIADRIGAALTLGIGAAGAARSYICSLQHRRCRERSLAVNVVVSRILGVHGNGRIRRDIFRAVVSDRGPVHGIWSLLQSRHRDLGCHADIARLDGRRIRQYERRLSGGGGRHPRHSARLACLTHQAIFARAVIGAGTDRRPRHQ